MRKNIIYIATVVCTTFFACTKNFDEINTHPSLPAEASTGELLNGIISSLPVTSGEYSVMNSWIYPITQLGVVAGSNPYNFDNARGSLWDTYYQALANYRELQRRIGETADPATMNNLNGMLKTLISYKTFKNTNYFGNIPYSEAGYTPITGESGYRAKYDNQEDIYTALLTDLKWAVDNFSNGSEQYSPGNYDTFFKGDIAKWTKFANSLRLYVAVTMYDKNPTLAGQHITEALSEPLLVEGDDIGLWPAEITGLQFQWRQWSFVESCNLRLGSTLWNLLSNNTNPDGSGIFDLRAKLFFETNASGQWAVVPQNLSPVTDGGTPYNLSNRTATWSNKGGSVYSSFNFNFAFDLRSIPELMLTAAQVYFLKAEVYNRGLGVTANQTTAKSEYESGIRSSLAMWKKIAFNASDWNVDKPTQAAVTTAEENLVLSNTKVAYDVAAPAESLLKIYAQLWIDQYRQPFDAWTLLRRTGGKTPKETSNATVYNNTYGALNRFRYPDDEQSYNNANWMAETGGSDTPGKKMWIQP